MTKIKFLLLSTILTLFTISNVYAKEESRNKNESIIIEKNYSRTIVNLAPECRFDRAKKFCNYIAQTIARNYERERVIIVNDHINYENPDFSFFENVATQKVDLNFIENNSAKIITVYAIIRSYDENSHNSINIKAFTYKLSNNKLLRFEELFENPELAGQLIGNIVENRYKKAKSKYLPIIISSLKINPNNFTLTVKGLRFFFAPNTVNTNPHKFESINISIKDLEKANPYKKWWPIIYNDKKNDHNK